MNSSIITAASGNTNKVARQNTSLGASGDTNPITSCDSGQSSFKNMKLSAEILQAIHDKGFTHPTPIQTEAIPLLLAGHDLVGRSCTGSGKTLAFGIPALERIEGTLPHAQVLVLSPTRELAMQIHDEMKSLSRHQKDISLAVVYGGASMSQQIKQLKQAQVVIGTPGRLMDHLRRKTLKLNHIQTVVLDEADEMLNMGFINDIETILSQVPEVRQTVLFSATMPAPLIKISQTFLTNPHAIDITTDQKNQADIEQTFYQVSQGRKREVLSLLMRSNKRRSMVFCNTRAMVDTLTEMLKKQGFEAAGLHGDMTQEARSKVMQRFREGRVHSLIATDVAARGIDVDNVDVVINYDLPQSFEYYVHRIGRTGRAGNHGLSQTLICNQKQYATLRSLMKYTGAAIQECKLPTGSEVMDKAVLQAVQDVQQCAVGQPGAAARKLMASLLEDSNFHGSTEEIALALAEMLMGGDEQFAHIEEEAAFVTKSVHKRSSGNRSGSSKNRDGGPRRKRKETSFKQKGSSSQRNHRKTSG